MYVIFFLLVYVVMDFSLFSFTYENNGDEAWSTANLFPLGMKPALPCFVKKKRKRLMQPGKQMTGKFDDNNRQ